MMRCYKEHPHTANTGKYLVLLLLLTTMMFSACDTRNIHEEEWVDLFNGQNLDGWDIKIAGYALNDNYAETFRVENGMLRVVYDGYDSFGGRFGHIYYEEPFSHYRLIAEYRFTGEQLTNGPGWAFRNNGIMFHSQPAHTVGLNQDFPNSIEFQLLGGDGTNDRPNGSICTPGTHVVVDGTLRTAHCIGSERPTNHGDEWVTAELEVYGDELIRHIINGEVVMEYSGTQLDNGTPLTEGYIALQSESHPTDFRSVRLLNLAGCMDEDARNYKSYFVKSIPELCEY